MSSLRSPGRHPARPQGSVPRAVPQVPARERCYSMVGKRADGSPVTCLPLPPAASKTSSAGLQTCCTSRGSSRSRGCLRCPALRLHPRSPLPAHQPLAPGRLWGGGGLRISQTLSLQGPPNFLRASALAEHIKPVVVIPEEAPEEEEPENLIEISSAPPAGEPVVRSPCPTVPLSDPEGLQTQDLARVG